MSASGLESHIDDLYRGPLEDFTAARTALGKTLTGAERERVSALQKPVALAWLVNQAYWRARPAYEHALQAGADLRRAQVGALSGRSTDVAAATRRHRDAVTDVVTAAVRLAQAAAVNPQRDELRRMFEAVTLAEALPAPHGRFVKLLQPAGFEALSGLVLPSSSPAPRPGPVGVPAAVPRSSVDAAVAARAQRARDAELKRLERERADADRRRQAAIATAEADVRKAAAAVERAEASWEQARETLKHAERALADLRAGRGGRERSKK